jgi:hypothetical protein
VRVLVIKRENQALQESMVKFIIVNFKQESNSISKAYAISDYSEFYRDYPFLCVNSQTNNTALI